ncbi:hypothetical protein F5146DRAFT_1026842 [Armillaria mellea]|nr:hypothetical protein F5146DRAFT_1026842 [Armillaria mellea]
MSKKFTQDYLESLTRQEVQALAKEHGIRANLSTKVIIENLLAISPATAGSEPKEPPAKVQYDAVEEASQAKKTPANASDEKAPAPPSSQWPPLVNAAKRLLNPASLLSRWNRPPLQPTKPAKEDEEVHRTIAEQLENHADKNGIRREQLDDIYHVLAGMQKNLCERQPEFMHHVTVRTAVEQLLVVPMKKNRTLVDGSGFLPRGAAHEWKKWHQENIIYPELFHPSNRLPGEEPAAVAVAEPV